MRKKKRIKFSKQKSSKIWRKGSKQIKAQLFLRCGRVDMYNMMEYAKEKLQLHHDPPVRLSQPTKKVVSLDFILYINIQLK